MEVLYSVRVSVADQANEGKARFPLEKRRVTDLGDGGAPRRGQRLAIEFANTVYAVRGRPQEGIGTVEHLAAWLRDHADQLTASEEADLLRLTMPDVEVFMALREAVRTVCAAVVDREPAAATALATLNRAAAAAPRWPELADDEGLTVHERTEARGSDAVLAEIARDAMTMAAGSQAERLRRCQGPGCILYFVKDHPRREWCSNRCGTRARVARHYQRHKPA